MPIFQNTMSRGVGEIFLTDETLESMNGLGMDMCGRFLVVNFNQTLPIERHADQCGRSARKGSSTRPSLTSS